MDEGGREGNIEKEKKRNIIDMYIMYMHDPGLTCECAYSRCRGPRNIVDRREAVSSLYTPSSSIYSTRSLLLRLRFIDNTTPG